MEQQSTIFDNRFDDNEIVRRRHLIATWLKVYTWIIICLGAFSVFSAFNAILVKSETEGVENYWTTMLIDETYTLTAYMLPGLLVWFEVKWAIWYNFILAVLWIGATLFFAVLVSWHYLSLGAMIIFYVPFWAGLFPIRHKWTVAVSGRTLRRKTR